MIRSKRVQLERVLHLIIDVITRWDSTCHMIVRALHLRPVINRYCQEKEYATPFSLQETEWKQIEYLVDLVRPFNFLTSTVGKTKGITLPYALGIYDQLYESLFESRRRLVAKRRKYPWVEQLIKGIEAAEAKIDKYYQKSYGDLGSVYAIGAILNPKTKLDSFDPEYCWLNPAGVEWREEFEGQFREMYCRNYKDKARSVEHLQHIRDANIDPLALMLDRTRVMRDLRRQSSSQLLEDAEESCLEVDEWLGMSKLYRNFILNFIPIFGLANLLLGLDDRQPLAVWKSLETQLPSLSAMARDLLCIPLAGVGVERVFNFARDMCGYRRGHLKPDTLRALLLVYHHQITEARTDELHKELELTMDIKTMSAEEIEEELKMRQVEMDTRLITIDSWDQVEYISDDEVPRASRRGLDRTTWSRERLAYLKRKAMRQESEISSMT
jgi:hypothetical protein